jgi:hypothetical protein
MLLSVYTWRYAAARPAHRPVAIFVTASLVADVVGRALNLLIAPVFAAAHGAPLSGLARLGFRVSDVCLLTWPLGLVALAFAVFLPREMARPNVRVAALLSVIFVVALLAVYPEIRGEARGRLYLGAEVAAVAASFAAGLFWLFRPEPPTLTDGSVLVFASLQIGALVDWHPTVSWDWQRAIYAAAFAVLVLLHLVELWTRRTV